MDKRPDLLRKKDRDWEEVYSRLTLDEIPWHSEDPDREFVDLVEEGVVEPQVVLDVGCGAGTDAIYLASRGCAVTAIDISEEAIGIAKKRAREAGVEIEFIADDFMKADMEKGSFDFINDRGCFHHMNPDKRKDFAVKIHTILQKDGHYYLRCWSDREEETERGPYRISRSEISDAFWQYFILGEIIDFRFGGRGARGYACLMRKER